MATVKDWAKQYGGVKPGQDMLDQWKTGTSAPTAYNNLFFRKNPYDGTTPDHMKTMDGFEWQSKGFLDQDSRYKNGNTRYLTGFYQAPIPGYKTPGQETSSPESTAQPTAPQPDPASAPGLLGQQGGTPPGTPPYGGLDFSALTAKYNTATQPGQTGQTGTNVQRVTSPPVYTDPRTTVAEQMAGLLSSDSPYMQAAEQRANQQMNSRGLYNSAAGVDAGTRAAIESALPIAQQDAQLYQDVQGANQSYMNSAGLQSNELQNSLSLQAQDAANTERLAYIDTFNKERLAGADTRNKEKLAYIDMDIRQVLAGTEQGYALELENLKSSYEIAKNADTAMGTMYSDAMKSIATFLQSPDLSPEQSSAGVKVIVDNLSSGLQFLSGISGTPEVGAPYVQDKPEVPPEVGAPSVQDKPEVPPEVGAPFVRDKLEV